MSIFDKKLSDVTVGDAAKGYAVYWVVGGVVSLIVGVIALSVFRSKTDDLAQPGFGFGEAGSPVIVQTFPSEREVSRADYLSVKVGTSRAAVEQRFGRPGEYQSGDGAAKKGSCVFYSRARSADKGFLLCFDGDQELSSKRGVSSFGG